MEKTKLVRTFGTALATATLSFGLFAAPAIAEVEVLDNPEVTVISNGNIIKGDARDGYRVWADIPVEAIEIDEAWPERITATNTRWNGTQKVTQKVLATGVQFLDENGYQLNASGGMRWDDVATVRAIFTVDSLMLDGVWTIDEVWFQNDAAEEVKTDIEATFTVQGNQDVLIPDLATNTPALVPTAANPIVVAAVPGPGGLKPTSYGLTITTVNAVDTVIATYMLPGGDTITRILANQDTNTFAFNDLEDGIVGLYKLVKLELIGDATVPDAAGNFGNHVVKEITDRDVLDNGDYSVTFEAGAYNFRDFQNNILGASYGAWFGNNPEFGVINGTHAQTMFRLYNKWTADRLYTGDPVERQTAIKNGWNDEQLGWYAPTQLPTPTPGAGFALADAYRLYNPWTGEHHFTTGEAERITMIANGWKDEGVGFKSFELDANLKQKQFSAKVFRLFNPFETTATHAYTTDTGEYLANILLGWEGEGVGWYGYKIMDVDDNVTPFIP